MSESSFTRIEATTTFQRKLRTLAKKYRRIRQDIEPILEQLQRGELPGDRIPGVGYNVFKLRVRNSDIQKGKSSGYRLIYYVKTTTAILLLDIYAKSEQSDISIDDIRRIIVEYDRGNGDLGDR